MSKSRLRERDAWLLLTLLLIPICGVSAGFHLYNPSETDYSTRKIAVITVKNAGLGDLMEGETKTYTKQEVPELGGAISVTTRKENVSLHLDSDLNSETVYSRYVITVKYAAVPEGSNHSHGETACALTKDSPDYSSINLDVPGRWAFDLDITTSAKSVDEESNTEITITVHASSTVN